MNNLREAERDAGLPTNYGVSLALRLSRYVHDIWADAPHDIGTRLAEIVWMRDANQALQSADTWREPDETTHPFAPLWFTYPGAGGWFSTCNSERSDIESMFRGVTFVIAKENQGPPTDDWEGKDK